jgi:hypothetical protein
MFQHGGKQSMATEKEIENDDDLDKPISGWWIPTASQLLPPIPGSSSPEAYEEFLKNTMESEAFRQFDEDVENAPSRSLFDFIKKAVNPPPSSFSYARISTMPDYYNRGVVQWPGLPPLSIRKIVKENLAPLMIIGMRTDDVLRYANLSRRSEPWKPGWSIATEDPNLKLDKHIRSEIRDAERFMLNCNIEKTNYIDRGDAGYSSFRTFLGALTRDSLTYDGMAIFTDRDLAGRVRAFSVMSAQNIRLTAPGAGYNGDKSIFAVGIDEAGNIVQEFSRNDLIFHVRNPRADPDIAGYGYSECEMAVRLIQGMTNAIDYNIDAFSRSCFSEDTQVLTKIGWKSFEELSSSDEIMSMNLTTGQIEYQQPNSIVWQDYEGDMYRLSSRAVDMLITPEHRILYAYRGGNVEITPASYRVEKAENFYKFQSKLKGTSGGNYTIPMTADWKGVPVEDRKFLFGKKIIGGFKKYEKSKKHLGDPQTIILSGDDYCAFMGMYLSGGNLAHSYANNKSEKVKRIEISQRKESRGWEPFWLLLHRMFGNVSYNSKSFKFQIECQDLAEYISQFGRSADAKFISDEIMNATPEQQKIFLEYYILGDGHTSKNKTKYSRNTNANGIRHTIVTTSKKMADQLQELILKSGDSASISIKSIEYLSKYKRSKINDREIIPKHDQYEIRIRKSRQTSFKIEKTYYKGKIGCVSVPNTIIYVRRNGKPGWSGNSVPNGMLIFSGSGWVRRTLDYLARLMTNAKRGTTKSWTVPFLAAPADGKVELLDFSKIKGSEAYYQDFINMMIGAFCAIYRFPATRIGYRVSGKGPDTSFNLKETGLTAADEADPGKEPLLGHLEHVLDIIVKSRWPHLKFQFHGKSPREDAREYEARILSMTQDEKRLAVGLPTMEERLSKEDREDPVLVRLAKIMGMAPVDPSQAGIYQNLASMAMGGSPGGPEAEFGSKKDPAVSEDHGHQSGVRRDSKKESTGKSRRKKTTKPPKANPDIQTTRLD